MEQRDSWHDMRKHLSEMADTIDSALRRVPPFSAFARGECPLVNVYEADAEVIVVAEVPGVRRESLKVSLKPDGLFIQGKEERVQFESCPCLCRERGAGEFSRRVSLPSAVDTNADPAATLENGLLTIRLRKKPAEPGKVVNIQVK
jgi:HSP20 family protein